MGCFDFNWVVAPGCTEIFEFHLAQSVLTADSAEMLHPALMSQCELEEPMWVMYLQPQALVVPASLVELGSLAGVWRTVTAAV